MTNQLEPGVVPEIGDLSLIPTRFMGQPTYVPSGGNVNITHVPVVDTVTTSLFSIFVKSNLLGQVVTEVAMWLADSTGSFRTIILVNRGNGLFEVAAATSLQTWNAVPRVVDRYAFRVLLSGGSINFIGRNGISYPSLPISNCILPGQASIGVMPEPRPPTLVDIVGTTQPDPAFYSGEQSIYNMLNTVKGKFVGTNPHTHDGANSSRVFHANIAGISPNDHHNKIHGLEDHIGNVIGTLSQISGVTVNAESLNQLDNGTSIDLHYHDSDRSRENHIGTQSEGSIIFSDTGHAHTGGGNGKRVAHNSLSGMTQNDHHAMNHGSEQHTGIIGTIEQINGLSPDVNAVKLVELCSGNATTLHSHPGLGEIPIELPLVESQIAFDVDSGHAHDGINGKKINPANLDGCLSVTAEKLNNLCNGSIITTHTHPGIGAGSLKEFGLSPEFANMTFDNQGIVDSNGTWLGGCDATLPAGQGGFHNFLEWTTDLPTPQTHRMRISVKLPNDFGQWINTSPISFWFKALYSSAEDVGLDFNIKDNVGLSIYSASVDVEISNGAWVPFIIPSIVSGSFSAGSWILITFEPRVRSAENRIKIGRIDFRYSSS